MNLFEQIQETEQIQEHYEYMPIQIYRKIHLQKLKFFR